MSAEGPYRPMPTEAWGDGDPDAGKPAEAPRTVGRLGWDITLWIALGIMGLLLLVNVAAFVAAPKGTVEQEVPQGVERMVLKVALWAATIGMLVVTGLVPLLWTIGTRVGGWAGAKRYLGLHRPGTGSLAGLGVGVLLVGAMVGLDALLRALGVEVANPELDGLVAVIDWPLAIAMALGAGIGEEILFRGVLQKHLGVLGQAGLFGLFHLTQGVLGFFVTALIGLLFGYLVRRGVPLWTVIVAHVTYDAVLLGVMLLGG